MGSSKNHPAGDEDRLLRGGRRAARIRAALALGSFDTTASIRALADGVANDQIAVACHAALYRITKDEKHLREVIQAFEKDNTQGLYLVASFFHAMNDGPAKQAAVAWRKAREEKRRR